MSVQIILTAAAMRAAERVVIDAGVPEYELMERAGAAAAEIIWRVGHKRETLILCGPGNNGGDGYVIARLLHARGVPVRVAATGDSRTETAARARAGWNGPVDDIVTARPAPQLVDALFGTGLTRGLEAALAARLGALVDEAAISHAIDLPSGVETDSGALLSDVPRFDVCIALGALKPAHCLYPARARFDRLVCADIGIMAESDVQMLGLPRLAAPGHGAHKYSRGLVAVVGGAMAGASLLAARAAAHAGAGMVRRIAVDAGRHGPDALVTVRAEASDALAEALTDMRIAVVLAGPGLGRDAEARARLATVLAAGRRLVLDADALTLLAQDGPSAIPEDSILTPHEGEFVRLFGALSGSKIDRAQEAARRTRSVIIYKGADTVIAAPDGRTAVAGSSSPWLSTAGTGDVLAGLVAARWAVTGDPFVAACAAVWLHGEAARRAGAAFIADDLIAQIAPALETRL
ncbi:NAD(P)H-hydrate dehydratase [Sphingobium aromaticiconvertens]|uniref:NAD(P)H-hydrate dehydratase n=1 Tax=Sphingobium aromaticiconvertens TaxID=365341 RepID=UPI003018C180